MIGLTEFEEANSKVIGMQKTYNIEPFAPKQEEIQSLVVPYEMAKDFSLELQNMLGNTVNAALGFHFYKRPPADLESGSPDAL